MNITEDQFLELHTNAVEQVPIVETDGEFQQKDNRPTVKFQFPKWIPERSDKQPRQISGEVHVNEGTTTLGGFEDFREFLFLIGFREVDPTGRSAVLGPMLDTNFEINGAELVTQQTKDDKLIGLVRSFLKIDEDREPSELQEEYLLRLREAVAYTRRFDFNIWRKADLPDAIDQGFLDREEAEKMIEKETKAFWEALGYDPSSRDEEKQDQTDTDEDDETKDEDGDQPTF